LTILNKRNNFFFNQALFLIGGFLAGILSLVILVVLDIFFNLSAVNQSFILIFFLVIVEEILKLSILLVLIDYPKKSFLFIKAFLFGLGFTLFEQFLIFLNFQIKLDNFNYLFVLTLVHTITSLLLIISLTKIKKSKIIAIIYFLLAIFIHLVYNLIVASL
jgi:RsiW-degrading membrane proteinase PrsW (M82 family)